MEIRQLISRELAWNIEFYLTNPDMAVHLPVAVQQEIQAGHPEKARKNWMNWIFESAVDGRDYVLNKPESMVS